MNRNELYKLINTQNQTTPKPQSLYSGNKKLDQPWYLDVADFISRPQRAITNSIFNITDNDSKTTFLGGLWDGISGTGKKDTGDILNNLGWKQRKAGSGYSIFGTEGALDLFDIIGFAGDVALDPLTYLTFGTGSLAKSGARAMAEEAARQASKYGVKVAGSGYSKGSAKRLTNNTALQIEEALLKQGKSAEEASRLAKLADAEIANAGRAARLRDQNALVNFDVPFTNISKSFGKKPKMLQVSDKAIDPVQVAGTMAMLSKLGGDFANPEQVTKLLQDRYTKSNIEELTQQELVDLQQLSKMEYSNKPLVTEITGKKSTRRVADELERVLKIADPNSTITAENLAKKFSKKDLLNQLETAVKTINDARAARAAKVSFADEMFNNLGGFKFQQDAGGTSFIGNKLRGLNPFNKRTVFGNDDPVLDIAAVNKTEADNKILSQTRQIEKDIENLQNMAKGLSDEEKAAIGYIIEKKFPEQFKDLDDYLMKTVGNTNNKKKLEDMAEYISKSTARYSQQEIDAGLLSRLRANYFPHVQDFDAQVEAGVREQIKENIDDPVIGKFIQQTSKNPYARNRKSFSTLAEVDDTVAKLTAQLDTLAPESAEYKKMFEQVKLLKTLFKRDPIEVFQERTKTAVRSAAMKALQDQYELDGLIIRNVKVVPTDRSKKGIKGKTMVDPEKVKQGFRRLDGKEAEALGMSRTIGRKDNEVILIREDLYDFLTQTNKYTEIDAINRGMEIANVATNAFKVLYTSAVPKHYFYNLIGSAFNNAMAGVSPDAYFKAGRLMVGLKNGTLTDKELSLINRALDEGVLNQTGYADLVRPEVLDKGRKSLKDKERQFYKNIDKVNQKIVDNPVSIRMRKYIGDPVDNINRLAHFVHVLETTKNVKMAAESVRKYLFNYNEVTTADRFVKIAIPFWNWMKNNIPLQIEKMITEPRILATYNQLREESFQTEDPSDYPKYIQEGFLQLPAENQFYNPRFPLQDVGQLGSPVKSIMNALTPVGKLPIEYGANYQFFSERPISYRALYDDNTGYFTTPESTAEVGKWVNANAGIAGDLFDAVGNYTWKPEEQQKPTLDLLLENLFGSTPSIRKE